jgi:heme oxygenase
VTHTPSTANLSPHASPGAASGLLHGKLRAATRGHHVRVDLAISQLDFADRTLYGAFLSLHLGALQALEPDWRAEDWVDFQNLARCLRHDLLTLGIAIPAPEPLGVPVSSPLSRLGSAYVIRGSRLGAQVIRKRVAPNFAASYFEWPLRVSWPEFLRQLGAVSLSDQPDMQLEVIRGATQTFELFLRLLGERPVLQLS